MTLRTHPVDNPVDRGIVPVRPLRCRTSGRRPVWTTAAQLWTGCGQYVDSDRPSWDAARSVHTARRAVHRRSTAAVDHATPADLRRSWFSPLSTAPMTTPRRT